MKTISKILTGLVIAVLLFVGYYVVSSRLSTAVKVSVLPAKSDEETFRSINQAVREGQYEGISSLDSIENYSFVTVSAEAKNYSLFPAEWAQFTIRPIEGDTLIVSSDAGPKDISSFGTGNLSVRLLTRSTDSTRSGWLEYYIFGRVHTLEVAPSFQGQN